MLVKNNLTYFEENKPLSVICINQAILKLWQVMVTKSDKVKTHLRHLACTYFVTPPFWGHWSQTLTHLLALNWVEAEKLAGRRKVIK